MKRLIAVILLFIFILSACGVRKASIRSDFGRKGITPEQWCY